jgi:hypothetical protein
MRIAGNLAWGFERCADMQYENIRDPERGNYTVEERFSGTIEEGFVRVNRPFYIDENWTVTTGPWEFFGG